MIYPPMKDLVQITGCRYTLVSVVSKRARQLVDGDAPNIEKVFLKPVTTAIHELSEGKLAFDRPPEIERGIVK